MGRRKSKDPTVQVPMRLPGSLVKRLNKTTTEFGKNTSRTAVVVRLLNDGYKWWAREDLEQDTTLQMVVQMHERTATILAMQNVMAQRMGLMEGEAGKAFVADVQNRKREILKLGSGVSHGLSAGDGRVVGSSSDDADDDDLDESDVDVDDDGDDGDDGDDEDDE